MMPTSFFCFGQKIFRCEVKAGGKSERLENLSIIGLPNNAPVPRSIPNNSKTMPQMTVTPTKSLQHQIVWHKQVEAKNKCWESWQCLNEQKAILQFFLQQVSVILMQQCWPLATRD